MGALSVGGIFLCRYVTQRQRLRAMIATLHKVTGTRNFTLRLAPEAHAGLQHLVSATNQLLEQIAMEGMAIRQQATALTAGVLELKSMTDDVANVAKSSQHQTTVVSESAVELKEGLAVVANATAGVGGNVRLLLQSVEGLHQQFASIDAAANSSVTETRGAAARSEDGERTMRELTEAAAAIGRVVEAIQEVAEQTNLLALNATIEAARAGEAGKGFAVVASEVKELAKQTAAATLDISSRVERIQSSSQSAARVIVAIRQAVDAAATRSGEIAGAVQVQKQIAADILSRLQAAEHDLQSVARGAKQAEAGGSSLAESMERADGSLREALQHILFVREDGNHLVTDAASLETNVTKLIASPPTLD